MNVSNYPSSNFIFYLSNNGELSFQDSDEFSVQPFNGMPIKTFPAIDNDPFNYIEYQENEAGTNETAMDPNNAVVFPTSEHAPERVSEDSTENEDLFSEDSGSSYEAPRRSTRIVINATQPKQTVSSASPKGKRIAATAQKIAKRAQSSKKMPLVDSDASSDPISDALKKRRIRNGISTLVYRRHRQQNLQLLEAKVNELVQKKQNLLITFSEIYGKFSTLEEINEMQNGTKKSISSKTSLMQLLKDKKIIRIDVTPTDDTFGSESSKSENSNSSVLTIQEQNREQNRLAAGRYRIRQKKHRDTKSKEKEALIPEIKDLEKLIETYKQKNDIIMMSLSFPARV
jgi:hypothetical protein